MKAALITPWLPHLPFHPACFFGYGAAILSGRYDLDVMDLNAECYFRYRGKLRQTFETMDKTLVAADVLLNPLFEAIGGHIDRYYAAISWKEYDIVYVTPPSWFSMVPAESVLRLSRAITRISPNTKIFFFGNSLGSWTNEKELKRHGIQTVHLNDLFSANANGRPINYDLLPAPIYKHRDKYLFDLLPFALKHGCSWGRCKFCSLSKGWNSGYVERSAKAAIKELELLVDQYNPKVLVCRDNSLNGHNLIEFCGYFQNLRKPWGGMCRAEMSDREIEALRTAGCRVLFFGLESGSDRTLRAMNKGITSRQMSDFIKRLHSREILPAPSLIIGAPGEGRVDFEKTLQFLIDHRRYLEVVNVYPFMATPASAFSSQKKQPDKDLVVRLFRLIQTCEDLGLKVIFGEQSFEYFLFKKICKGHATIS